MDPEKDLTDQPVNRRRINWDNLDSTDPPAQDPPQPKSISTENVNQPSESSERTSDRPSRSRINFDEIETSGSQSKVPQGILALRQRLGEGKSEPPGDQEERKSSTKVPDSLLGLRAQLAGSQPSTAPTAQPEEAVNRKSEAKVPQGIMALRKKSVEKAEEERKSESKPPRPSQNRESEGILAFRQQMQEQKQEAKDKTEESEERNSGTRVSEGVMEFRRQMQAQKQSNDPPEEDRKPLRSSGTVASEGILAFRRQMQEQKQEQDKSRTSEPQEPKSESRNSGTRLSEGVMEFRGQMQAQKESSEPTPSTFITPGFVMPSSNDTPSMVPQTAAGFVMPSADDTEDSGRKSQPRVSSGILEFRQQMQAKSAASANLEETKHEQQDTTGEQRQSQRGSGTSIPPEILAFRQSWKAKTEEAEDQTSDQKGRNSGAKLPKAVQDIRKARVNQPKQVPKDMQTIEYRFKIVGDIYKKLLMQRVLDVLNDYRYNTVITKTILSMFSTVSTNLRWYDNLDNLAVMRQKLIKKAERKVTFDIFKVIKSQPKKLKTSQAEILTAKIEHIWRKVFMRGLMLVSYEKDQKDWSAVTIAKYGNKAFAEAMQPAFMKLMQAQFTRLWDVRKLKLVLNKTLQKLEKFSQGHSFRIVKQVAENVRREREDAETLMVDDIFLTLLETVLEKISQTTLDGAFRDEMASKSILEELLLSTDELVMTDIAEPIVGDIRENQKTADFIFEDLVDEFAYTDVMQPAISQEELLQSDVLVLMKALKKSNLAFQKINRQHTEDSFASIVDYAVQNKIRVEGLTKRLFSVIETIYARQLFRGMGCLMGLEDVEIQPMEFAKIGKSPVSSAPVPHDAEDSESDTPEEKRSSMAKVPAFIQQLREQERKTEERRSSMAKVPEWLQGVRERNTVNLKPSQIQTISEEVQGAQRQTISGNSLQMSLTEQIKKQQAQKICNTILGEICDNIVDTTTIKEEIFCEFLDHIIQENIHSTVQDVQLNHKTTFAIAGDFIDTFVQEISKTTLDDTFREDMASKFIFDELLLSILPEVAELGKEDRLNDLAVGGIVENFTELTTNDLVSSIAIDTYTDESAAFVISDDVVDMILLSDIVEPIVGDIRENQKTADFIYEDLIDELAYTDVMQTAISNEELLQSDIRVLLKKLNKFNLAVYNINRQHVEHSFEAIVDEAKQNKIRVEGNTKHLFSLLETIYARQLFRGLGCLTGLEAVEIQPMEFEKIGKSPVSSAPVLQDFEDSESNTPEEKRSSMAKVPAFIQQLREQERKTEERRSSMAKVPDWIQAVRERNTVNFKPSQIQTIPEEDQGAQRQTISGNSRQMSLTEQIRKQQAQKICNTIVGEICDNIVDTATIKEEIFGDFLDHIIQDNIQSQVQEAQINYKATFDIAGDFIDTFVYEISKTTLDDTFREDMACKFIFDELLLSILPEFAELGKEDRLNDLAVSGIVENLTELTSDDLASSIAIGTYTDESTSVVISDDVVDIVLLSDIVKPIVGDIRANQKIAPFIFEDFIDEVAYTDVMQTAISNEELLQSDIRVLQKTLNKVQLAVYNINRIHTQHSFSAIEDEAKQNKIRVEGITKRLFSVLETLYSRQLFRALGSLTGLDAIEIQPMEFEKIRKTPVSSAAVPYDPENFESNTPEEKRSSYAKVPAFIQQLREQERKTEERRSSMAKVPDWIQGVRERNTVNFKPSQIQTIPEEVQGAQRQTISGNAQQLSLTDQIRKQQALKICNTIVGEICDNIVDTATIKDELFDDFLDHLIQDNIKSQVQEEQMISQTTAAIADDFIQQLASDIAITELDDMQNDASSSDMMENLLCEVLSTDVVFESISEEEQNQDSAKLLCQKVNKAWYAAFSRGLVSVVQNKIHVEGLTKRMFSVLESIYKWKLFNGLGNLTELETIEIPTIEFEKSEKIPVSSAAAPQALEDDESRSPEEKRSSYAKVPSFIQQLREQERKTEERRSSLAKVPDWLQGVRSRNTVNFKPTQIQTIVEEDIGEKRKTIGGSLRQLSLTEQIRKQQAVKICNTIIHEISDKIIDDEAIKEDIFSGLVHNLIQESIQSSVQAAKIDSEAQANIADDLISNVLATDVAKPLIEDLQKDLKAAAEIPEKLVDDLLVTDVVSDWISEWKNQLKNAQILSDAIMSNSYLRYMRNIFKNIKVAKSEPRKTEEKRSSMAKVPDFIANLRERTTEEKRGSMTQVPDFIKNLRERSTEEKRGSLTQVPNYIQQIRERSTMKPSEMQAISEEVKGAKRKTLSGHERQRQLQEQVQKKEETNKCCEDIVDHLLEHLVSGLANNVIEESERDEEIAHYLSEMYILRTIRDTCQNSIDDCYDVQAIPAVIDELLDDLVVKDFVQPISTYILHNTRAIHQISSELVFKILVDDIICPQVLEAQELALKSKAVSDVILRLKQKNFIRRLQRAATLSKINSFSSTITHVWKGAFIRGLQLTAQRSLRVESLTGRLASTLNFSIFRHIRAIFKTIQEYDPHGPTTEDIRYQQIMNSIAHWQAHKTRADILGLIRKLPAARKAQKEAREQELLEALYSIFERKIVRREVAQLAAAEIKKEKIISEIQVAVDTDNLTQGLPEGTFESPRSSPAKTYFYGSPDYPSFEDEELRDSPPNKLQGSSYYGLAPVPKNPQSSLPIAQVKNYYIENPAAIGAEEKDIDAVCIHCYENIKLIDMDFHSQICTGEVAQPPDENLEVDQRVVKLLNSVSERSLLCGMDVFKFFNSITQIGESIICMSGDMSTLQNELQIISDAASEYADGFSVVVYCKRLSYLASLKGQQNQVAQLTAENLLLHYEAEAAKQRAELEKWKSYSEALLNLANEAHEPIEEIDSDVGSMQERFSANSAFSIMSESDTYSEIEFSARYMGEEEKKKLFFGFCLKFKLRIPRTHPGNALSMNEVYKEAMTEKIEIDRWEEFIENKLSNA